MTIAYFNCNSFKERSMLKEEIKKALNANTCFVCIGTDRSIGDSFGPLVGTMLKKRHMHLNVYGTLTNPIHALNIYEKLGIINELEDEESIIAIDAAVCDEIDDMHKIAIREHGVLPGSGLGKILPYVGEKSIIFTEPEIAIKTPSYCRLSIIYSAAEALADVIYEAYEEMMHENAFKLNEGKSIWGIPIAVSDGTHTI